MILDVTLDQRDEFAFHRQCRELFTKSEGGMMPVKFSGKFRFLPEFSVEAGSDNIARTKFKVISIDSECSIELLETEEGDSV